MRKSVGLLLIILSLLLILSCDIHINIGPSPYTLFPSNVMIPPPTSDANRFTGTYLLSQGQTVSAFVSFDGNGKVLVASLLELTPNSAFFTNGSWRYYGSNQKISILGRELLVAGDITTGGQKIGFFCKLSSDTDWNFIKVSDHMINLDIYKSSSLLCNKVWGRTEGYYTSGYRFYEDGDFIFNSNKTNERYIDSYTTKSYTKPWLILGDGFLRPQEYYPYLLIGEYLYLGFKPYGCYGQSVPVKAYL